MKKVLFIVMILVIGIVGLADAEESSCRDKLLKICTTNEAGNPICQILKQDAMETPESIVAFFEMIRPLEKERQELMICARLVGRKRLKLGIVPDKLKSCMATDNKIQPWVGNTYTHYIFAHHPNGGCSVPFQSIPGTYTSKVYFRFPLSNSTVNQWFMIRRMNPFENDLDIIVTVDIDNVNAKWNELLDNSTTVAGDVNIQQVVSVDSESSRKIQQRMSDALKVGLE